MLPRTHGADEKTLSRVLVGVWWFILAWSVRPVVQHEESHSVRTEVTDVPTGGLSDRYSCYILKCC